MTNQAQGLARRSVPSGINVIAVTSGKGGVGKTNISVNLAVSLASRGRSVVLFDADLGLANVDITLGLKAKYDIRHVISGERTLEEVILNGPRGLRIVPAASGISGVTRLSTQEQASLIRAFSDLTFPVDTLIVDTAGGLDPSILTFASACQEIIVVVCDEPTSITDAYALIKVLNIEYGVKRFQVLVNMVAGEAQGRHVYGKVSRVSDRFLDIHLAYLGFIPRDEYLRKAVQQQVPVVQSFPRSHSAQALVNLAETVDIRFKPQPSDGGLGFFIERLIHIGCVKAEVLS